MCARCQQAEKRNKFSKKRSVHSLKLEERGPVFTTFPVVCRTEILALGLRSSDSIFHREPIVLSVAWGSPAGASSDSTRLNSSIFQLHQSLTHFLGLEINKVDYWGSAVLLLWSPSCTYLLSLQPVGLPFAPWGPEGLLPPCRSEQREIQWWMCLMGGGGSLWGQWAGRLRASHILTVRGKRCQTSYLTKDRGVEPSVGSPNKAEFAAYWSFLFFDFFVS